MDELSEDQLRELEEQLYSQVHHQISQDPMFSTVEINNDAKEIEPEINKVSKNRYWDDQKGPERDMQNKKSLQDHKVTLDSKAEKENIKERARFAQPVNKPAVVKEKRKNQKVCNPFAMTSKGRKQMKNANLGGPFGRQAQQLQRAVQYDQKKQKSKNAHASTAKRPKVVETVVLDSESDSDQEVIIVPLPENPVYNVDDSEEEEPKVNITKKETPNTVTAKDAFTTPKSLRSSSTALNNEVASDTASRCNSPNSVMSHDDFIGQSDRHRLLKSGSMADDADLMSLTNNTDSLLEPPTPPTLSKGTMNDSSDEIECTGTFIKPTTSLMSSSAKGNSQQSYRVDQNGFRAMDVYESESDIVSDGVYSKGMTKSQPQTTIIRNIDNSSGSEDDATTTVQIKTKRLRKRRASGSLRGSESNGAAESSDSEGDDGVVITGIPFIARGPAVESCKSKRFRRSTTSSCDQGDAVHGGTSGHMSDSEFMATISSLAQGSKNDEGMSKSNEDDDSEGIDFPTARDIAENVLQQQQPATSTPVRRKKRQERESSNSNNKTNNDLSEAVPAQIADDIEKIFDKITKISENNEIEISDEDDFEDSETSTISQTKPAINDSTAKSEKTLSMDQGHNDGDIKYFIAYSPADKSCLSNGFGWDEEMDRFYNCSWGGENANEEDVFRRMNKDRRLWAIHDSDRISFRKHRDRREKCTNCFSFGHIRSRCPKPRKPLVCYMCGESGHQEPRCPNTICLRCGSKTNVFSKACKKCMYWNNRICPICKLRGHSLYDCPDKWRRYHSTTRPNVYPNSRVFYNKRRYCCFCGRRGHLYEDCKQAMFRSEYPMIASDIKSHEKSYEDVIENPYDPKEIPCRLLYDPNVSVNFGLAAKTSHNKVYGRFLSAVGLKHLIGVNPKKAVTNEDKIIAENVVTTQPSCSSVCPEQVAEISESAIEAEKEVPQATEKIDENTSKMSEIAIEVEAEAEVLQAAEKIDKNTSEIRESAEAKADAEVLEATENIDRNTSDDSEKLQMPPPRIPEQPLQDINQLMDHDSDSNYSFSDHFEMPTASVQRPKTEPLPDFISINSNSQPENDSSIEDPERQTQSGKDHPQIGISAKYVAFHSDEEDAPITPTTIDEPVATINEPCEAKIYVSDDHSKYLQSELGQEFLKKIMLENNLKGNLNRTIVGYALFLFGLPSDQEKLQRDLELKFKTLNDAKLQHYEASSKVPKNVDVLIRFLRDSINQLYSNLGNVLDLYKRLIALDSYSSKNSVKSADRVRRTLNMIFLGQAGLIDGDKHVDTLLKALNTLINDYKGSDKTPEALRNKIDASWRMLFTPYHHENYSQLLLDYMKIPSASRNRMPLLKVEPTLLGKSQFSISLKDEQKSRSNVPTQLCDSPTVPIKKDEEGTLLLNIVGASNEKETDSKKNTSDDKSNSQEVQTNVGKKQQQQNTKRNTPKLANSGKLSEKDYQALLAEIAQPSKPENSNRNNVSKDSKLPSPFWSRESQRFLTELIESASDKPTILERLQRINQKAKAGGLSFNDYRAVIELFNVTKKISRK